jgi:fructuronate reductase
MRAAAGPALVGAEMLLMAASLPRADAADHDGPVAAAGTMKPDPAVPRLSRAVMGRGPAAPVRIAHLGLGGFSRAHQAWYTAHAPDGSAWGIAGFTGRSPELAQRLAPQDGLYTLVTRGDQGPTYDVIDSLSEVHAASDHQAWLELLARPALAIVTLTVTEAGYCRDAAGELDEHSDAVRRDIDHLRADPSSAVSTVPGRLVAGLLARRAAGSGPITILPCDNLPRNGAATASVVGQLARAVDPSLVAWIGEQVSFATTMVDRITPRAVDADLDEVRRATGYQDEAPVVTEPYAEWVLSGAFPAGRPRWEDAGARFVDDVEPFETRKLWLLNGAHTILALGGSIRGHQTVAGALADPLCRSWIEQWWDEAQMHLTLPAAEIEDYRAALRRRFANRAIEHRLSQIATDSSQKVPVRILPVLLAERAAGRMPPGAARAVAAWVLHLRGEGAPISDPAAAELAPLVDGTLGDAVARMLHRLDPSLGADGALVAETTTLAVGLSCS